MKDDLATLKLALNDMCRRARGDKRYLDVGILEGVICYLDDGGAPEAPAEKPKRGRPRQNGAGPASVSDLTGGK